MMELGQSGVALLLIAGTCMLIAHAILRRHWGREKRNGSKLRVPPGPRPWPVIGNLPYMRGLPHQALANLAKMYGPLMMLRLGSMQTLVVSSPKMAEEVLKTHDRDFASRPSLLCSEIMGYGSQNFGFLPYGEQWRHARSLFTSRVVSVKRIEDTQRMRKDEIMFMVDSMLVASKGGTVPVAMLTHFFRLSLNMSTRMLMSRRCFGASTQEIDNSMKEFLADIYEMARLYAVFNIGDFIPRLKRFDLQGYEKDMWAVRKNMDVFLGKLMETRTDELRTGKVDEDADFLSVLLGRPMATVGNPMTDEQIKGMILDVLFAGVDTIAIALEWTLTELIRKPAVVEKCQEELDKVVGTKRLVEDSDLPSLPYILAVVQESLRLHPVGALLLPHLSTQDCEIGGYFIPAGTRTIINAWAIQRDTSVWDRALEFEPQRFLKIRPDQGEKENFGNEFGWLPFGSGRRGCPGKQLAMKLLHSTLATLLQCFQLSLPPSMLPTDVDMREKFGLGVSKAVMLELILTPRLATSVICSSEV